MTMDELGSELKSSFRSFNDVYQSKLTAQQRQLSEQQRQLDALDSKIAGNHTATEVNNFEQKLRENDSLARLIRDKKGSAVFAVEGADAVRLLQRKTTIISTLPGYQPTSGVLEIQRVPGVVLEPRQQLLVEDLLPKNPTALQICDFVKVSQPMTIASPVPESSLKPEETVTFVSSSERVKTIACTIPSSRQILDDFSELNSFLNDSLSYYTNLATEIQLLSGDGVGEDLHGLIPQSSSFNTGLLNPASGWQRIDILARCAQQLALAKELQPDFVVLNPTDLWSIQLTKNSLGNYIVSDPGQTGSVPSLWGIKLVATTSIASGSFLMGSSSPIASEIRDRMQLVVELSTQHADFFARNLVMLRCERRLALLVKRGSAFISGSFITSPIS